MQIYKATTTFIHLLIASGVILAQTGPSSYPLFLTASNAVNGSIPVPDPGFCCGMAANVTSDGVIPVSLWLPHDWSPSITQNASGATVITDTHANGEIITLTNVPAVTFSDGFLLSLSKPVNGKCGTANGIQATAAPTTNLCAVGTASAVSGSGPWTWQCSGANGGTTQSCSAPLERGHAIVSGSVITPAALKAQPTLCAGNGSGFPTQTNWNAATQINAPQAATSGTPKIEQYRPDATSNTPGATYYTDPTTKIRFIQIATWQYMGAGTCSVAENAASNPSLIAAAAASGCGPFGRAHYWRAWLPGDLFLVYPAVYDASDDRNQPWIGPQFDNDAEYSAGTSHIPTNLTIKGVVANGVEPTFVVGPKGGGSYTTLGQGIVYLDHTVGMTIANIDYDAGGVANRAVSRAGIYLVAPQNTTFQQVRVHGFETAQANGIFGIIRGTLNLNQVELAKNGGEPDSAAHNIYISSTCQFLDGSGNCAATGSANPDFDPNATVNMTNSWSHDAFYGHTFKSRAPFK